MLSTSPVQSQVERQRLELKVELQCPVPGCQHLPTYPQLSALHRFGCGGVGILGLLVFLFPTCSFNFWWSGSFGRFFHRFFLLRSFTLDTLSEDSFKAPGLGDAAEGLDFRATLLGRGG